MVKNYKIKTGALGLGIIAMSVIMGCGQVSSSSSNYGTMDVQQEAALKQLSNKTFKIGK